MRVALSWLICSFAVLPLAGTFLPTPRWGWLGRVVVMTSISLVVTGTCPLEATAQVPHVRITVPSRITAAGGLLLVSRNT
ncbi:hypothetical protein B0T14DRAFT_507846 [Immersiella caudata]|uniref:Uncharacterized protein n=1 Tax=Immersiella caudata TaxID=314043 RepID=A0AA39XGW6_9PEZI|nr:hypothetical protein B0T14DRAFT_507846 [Immersiella caudata]